MDVTVGIAWPAFAFVTPTSSASPRAHHVTSTAGLAHAAVVCAGERVTIARAVAREAASSASAYGPAANDDTVVCIGWRVSAVATPRSSSTGT